MDRQKIGHRSKSTEESLLAGSRQSGLLSICSLSTTVGNYLVFSCNGSRGRFSTLLTAMLSKLIILSCLVAVAICESKLKVDVVSVPEGCTVKSKNGDMLTMHYTGKLTDGTKFDSSLKCGHGGMK
uniref:peptidylprolyl isomerase n=1 Tax=Anopheles epiroticus TaxID=199890 RepID=A0A182PD26_9DIPT